MTRACFACAATEADGAQLPERKPTRRPMLCTDCDTQPDTERAERIRQRRTEIARNPPISRASYRAALRHRNASPQLDLVDRLVRSP
jgi:hypothetical protein